LQRIVTFGNCQAEALASFLRRVLPATSYSISFYSNNSRTGDLRPEQEILGAVREADVVVYQPLDDIHGALSEASVRATVRSADAAVSFVYLFNSGICSLIHVPQALDHPYGFIFGEETIIDRLDQGASAETVIDEYVEGSLDFGVSERFESCLAELERREQSTKIKLAGFIHSNYRQRRQFLTHNHPSTDLLVELCVKLRALTDLPIDLAALLRIQGENAAGLPFDEAPVSPHDASTLGYEFGHDPDWVERGTGLIRRIAADYDGDPEKRGTSSTRGRPNWHLGHGKNLMPSPGDSPAEAVRDERSVRKSQPS